MEDILGTILRGEWKCVNTVALRELARAKARKAELSTAWKKVFLQYNKHVKSEKCVSCKEMYEGFLEEERKLLRTHPHVRGVERVSEAAKVAVHTSAAKLA